MQSPMALGRWVSRTTVDCISPKTDTAADLHTQYKAVILRPATRCLGLHNRLKRLFPPCLPLSPTPPLLNDPPSPLRSRSLPCFPFPPDTHSRGQLPARPRT